MAAVSRRPGSSRISSLPTRLFGVNEARQRVSEGMLAFRQSQVPKSIELFDQAEQEEPRYAPFLWQRGLSYYYANEFTKARQQFQLDVKVNPLDVEEIVWCVINGDTHQPVTPWIMEIHDVCV